jgi:hypothetical protein
MNGPAHPLRSFSWTVTSKYLSCKLWNHILGQLLTEHKSVQDKNGWLMTNSAKTVLCHSLFRELDILPLQAQCILLTHMFIITKREVFQFNSQVHKFNTRSAHDLYYHQANLPQFQEGICYMVVKVFNHLPPEIKSMSNRSGQRFY